MSILILSTNSKSQDTYWKRHLHSGSEVHIIHEEWKGGAGNWLGTLYAFAEVQKKRDLLRALREGTSVIIYHTAGKGTRMYPLTASEGGNKSAVRLTDKCTLLEAVIRQTMALESSQKGRLSVFLGDQIFLPSKPIATPSHHAEIFTKKIDFPTKETWQKGHFEQYGLFAIDSVGRAREINKTTYEKFDAYSNNKTFDSSRGLGISLGSFTLSYEALCLALEVFSKELAEKKGQMDVEPSVWLAASFEETPYVEMMQQSGLFRGEEKKHYARMKRYFDMLPGKKENFLGMLDIGQDAYWWDYGNIESYYQNLLKLLSDSEEGKAMREFFHLKKQDGSVISNSEIGSGRVRNSILFGVKAKSLDVENAVVINAELPSLEGKNFLLYNVKEKKPLVMKEKSVRADALIQETHMPIKTNLGRDSKNDWEVKLPGNTFTYKEIFKLLSSP